MEYITFAITAISECLTSIYGYRNIKITGADYNGIVGYNIVRAVGNMKIEDNNELY